MLPRLPTPPTMVGFTKKLKKQSSTSAISQTTTDAHHQQPQSHSTHPPRPTQQPPSQFTHPPRPSKFTPRVTFSPCTNIPASSRKLRSPPLTTLQTNQQSSYNNNDALPHPLPDEVYTTGFYDIPLLFVKERNSIYVHDTRTDIKFLVDTGAEKSIMPVDPNKPPSNHYVKLIAANGSYIDTYGEELITLTFGNGHKYHWKFVIADVEEPLLGADFLKEHNLMVDIKGRQLVKSQRQPTINQITHCEPYHSMLNQFGQHINTDTQSNNTPPATHF